MKRLFVIILSIVMLMTLLSACTTSNKNNDTQTNTPPTNTGTNSGSESSSNDEEGLIPSAYGGVPVTPPGVLPIVKEPVKLTIMIAQHPNVEDYNDNKMTKYMEEKTGVDIEWVIVPSQEASQRVNLLLASQVDLPDVLMIPSGISNEVVSDMADQGVFLQLDDMISKLAYWYAERRTQDPLLEKLLKLPDGHEYTMPKVVLSEPNSMSRRAWINQKWLDNLGLKTPTTTGRIFSI